MHPTRKPLMPQSFDMPSATWTLLPRYFSRPMLISLMICDALLSWHVLETQKGIYFVRYHMESHFQGPVINLEAHRLTRANISHPLGSWADKVCVFSVGFPSADMEHSKASSSSCTVVF
jgi:hypothetical protein